MFDNYLTCMASVVEVSVCDMGMDGFMGDVFVLYTQVTVDSNINEICLINVSLCKSLKFN